MFVTDWSDMQGKSPTSDAALSKTAVLGEMAQAEEAAGVLHSSANLQWPNSRQAPSQPPPEASFRVS